MKRDTELSSTFRERPYSPGETVNVSGKVLYVNPGVSVKLWTLVSTDFVPLSLIRDSDPPKDELEEGDQVEMEIPLWLAREKGWAE